MNTILFDKKENTVSNIINKVSNKLSKKCLEFHAVYFVVGLNVSMSLVTSSRGGANSKFHLINSLCR